MEAATNEQVKGKGKKLKKVVLKTLTRTFNQSASNSSTHNPFSNIIRSKSWHAPHENKYSKKHLVAPQGCCAVYVGPEKQRFVIKTEFINHPLFKNLLDDAEMEYGYNCEGPLTLPCEVQLFHYLLWEMSSECSPRQGCNFVKPQYSPYRRFTPSPI